MIDLNTFSKVTTLVIDTLEGGYFHPDMFNDGRLKGDARYNTSGETMFGIDRKNGGADINNTPEGILFWQTIDAQNARKNWNWNYRGGNLEGALRDLVVKMMYKRYNNFAAAWLSKESRSIIESTPALLFHFVYACWNGSGWFLKFANEFNAKVKAGERDINILTKLVIDQRTKEGYTKGSAPDSLILQGGKKIESLFKEAKKISGIIGQKADANKSLIGIVIIVLFIAFLYKVK